MLDISSNQVIAAATVALVIVGILTLFVKRRSRQNRSEDATPALAVYSGKEFPTIHATSGVPTLEQLTRGIEVDPKDRLRARVLYDSGLEQFNHYVNNRDGVVAEARREMTSLAEQMEQSEVTLAERIGIALTGDDNDDPSESQAQYDSLPPLAQIYAQQKRHEHEALQLIANDLQKNIPRTDYTSVKSRIESGEMPLDSIMSELPLPWQDLRTISQVAFSSRVVVKPPKRQFVHAMFLMPEGQLVEDKRAERDGKWLRSDKYGMLAPYTTPLRVMRERRPEGTAVPTGKFMVVVPATVGPEWLTELLRQGGYRDQQYILARDGMLPEQVREAYRRQLMWRIIWGVLIALFVVDVVLWTSRLL